MSNKVWKRRRSPRRFRRHVEAVQRAFRTGQPVRIAGQTIVPSHGRASVTFLTHHFWGESESEMTLTLSRGDDEDD